MKLRESDSSYSSMHLFDMVSIESMYHYSIPPNRLRRLFALRMADLNI